MRKIEQSTIAQNGKVRVTFSMPGSSCSDNLYLVGWFSEWGESVYAMQRTAEGSWSVTLELELGCEYQYRFRTAEGKWLKDTSISAGRAEPGPNTSFVISRDSLR